MIRPGVLIRKTQALLGGFLHPMSEQVDKPRRLLYRVAGTTGQAHGVLRYSRQRWACEEGAELLKGRVGLERFWVRRYEAIRCLAILAMVARGFLTSILLRSRDLTKRLYAWTSRFRHPRPFLHYRPLDALQESVRLNPAPLTRLPPDPRSTGQSHRRGDTVHHRNRSGMVDRSPVRFAVTGH